MLSTLFLLVLSGILLQGTIKISANYIIQLNQISAAYQAKTALNMSEKMLKDYIVENNNELPSEVQLSSSIGYVQITKNKRDEYEAVITHKNGVQFTKKITIEKHENNPEETEDDNDLLKKELIIPNETENIIFD